MRILNYKRPHSLIPAVCVCIMTATLPARAQVAPTAPDRAAPADGWQRGLEIGGMFATFLTMKCGDALLARMDGDVATEKRYGSDLGLSYNTHRAIHVGLGVTAFSLNLASAWQQIEVNRQRDTFEFRHWAHNALFWTSLASLVASGTLGIVGTQTDSRDLDLAMRVTGKVSFYVSLADVVLFGGHDNAILFTDYKWKF